ncbi:MAG: hypothetical protein IKW93_06235 [Bacteroidales bacterium]|nr:hypothetical protein [Bacteroidales bacterium]
MNTIILICLIIIVVLLTVIVIKHVRKARRDNTSIPEKLIPSLEYWGANTNQTRIFFDPDLPFTPDVRDIIYVENEYDPVINEYISMHYKELCRQFNSKDLKFNYLPKLCNQDVPKEVLQYMFPHFQLNKDFSQKTINAETLKPHLLKGVILGPALIHFLPEEENPSDYCFSYCPLVPDSAVPLSDQFEWYISTVSRYYYDGKPRYSLVPPQGDEVADACFNDGDADSSSEYSPYMQMDPETTMLVKEIRDRINELRKRGFQMGLLRDLIEEQPTLSRLVIDKDFRIFLPDYNNMEIIMSPLPKAVYLLFLKHPEGIVFKQLHDYYPELLDIYKRISNRVVEKKILKSINDITDPTKNSINEKCTRIREAFLKQFDYVYARHYFITGKRGEPKRITLPRELVDLQAL